MRNKMIAASMIAGSQAGELLKHQLAAHDSTLAIQPELRIFFLVHERKNQVLQKLD